MADDLNYKINLETDIDTSKANASLDKLEKRVERMAQRMGVSFADVTDNLDFNIDNTFVTELGRLLGELEAASKKKYGKSLSEQLGGNDAAQQQTLNYLRDRLSVLEKISKAESKINSGGQGGNIRELMAEKLFGNPKQNFAIGPIAKKFDENALKKQWIALKDSVTKVEDEAPDTIDAIQGLVDTLDDAFDSVFVSENNATQVFSAIAEEFNSAVGNINEQAVNLAKYIGVISKGQVNLDFANLETLKSIATTGTAKPSAVQELQAQDLNQPGVRSIKALDRPVVDAATALDAFTRVLKENKGALLGVSEFFSPAKESRIKNADQPSRIFGKNFDPFGMSDRPEIDPYTVKTFNKKLANVVNIEEVKNKFRDIYVEIVNDFNDSLLEVFQDEQGAIEEDMNNAVGLDRAALKASTFKELKYGFTPDLNVASANDVTGRHIQELLKHVGAIQKASPQYGPKGQVFGEEWVQRFFEDIGAVDKIQQHYKEKLEKAIREQEELDKAKTNIPESMQDTGEKTPVKLDWKENLRRKLKEQLIDQGPEFAVAVDTEFNHAIDQKITEFSAVFKDINGGMHDLLTFIHLPLDPAGLASDRTPFGAKSIKDLQSRAKNLGIDPSKLGDLEDPVKNKQMAYNKAKALVDLFDVLAELDIPITGSSLSAENTSIKGFIKFANGISESIGKEKLPNPDVLRKVFDSVTEFRNLPSQNELKAKLPVSDKNKPLTGLQPIMNMIAKEFPDFLARFSDIIQMTDKGPMVRGLSGGKGMPAHYAQADAIMSLIVKEFFSQFAGAAAVRTMPVPKAGNAGGGGKPPQPPIPSAADMPEDPMAGRNRAALERNFITGRDYQLRLHGLTELEKNTIAARLAKFRSEEKQVDQSAKILEKENKLEAVKARLNELRKKATDEQLAFAKPGIAKQGTRGVSSNANRPMGPIQDAFATELRATADEARALETELLKLNRIGMQTEERTIAETIANIRGNDVKEQYVQNSRKQLDIDMQRNVAGKQFTAATKQRVKDELEAQKALQRANKEQVNQWVTARYALYDVGNFYTNVYQQMFRLTRQIFDTTKAYRTFETAFTSVERAMQLSGTSAISMRDQFIKMSGELPIAFDELTKIATLGAQMGIGANGIQAFTENIAQFASITGISADTVAQKFGRIAELAKVDSSDFNKLGSAVAYAGVNAVATESEILSLSEAIAAVSTNVGFTPQEVIGLSTALASVGVQAEQARGVFTRVFADIDRAVSKGGPSLEAFAKASGMSSEAFAQAWGKDGKAGDVFRQFLAGLGSSANITKTFDSLNIVESREINTLTRLAKSLDVVDQAMSDANSSYAEGTFLGESFGKTVDNLDSQLVIFKNNLDAVSAAFGAGFGQSLKDIVKSASQFLEFVKGASKAPLAQALLPSVALLTGIAGASALAVAGVTKLIAQIYAFRVAQIQSMNASSSDLVRFRDRIKQLSGAYSGLIEKRSKLHGFAGAEKQRGEVVPVTYKAFDQTKAQVSGVLKLDYLRTVELSKQAQLLKDQNIYLVSARGLSSASFESARKQADAVQRFVEARKSRAAALVEAAVPGTDDASRLRKAAMLEELATKRVLISVQGEEIRVMTQKELANLKDIAGDKMKTKAEREKAAAIVASTVAINANTETATGGTVKWTAKLASLSAGLFSFLGVAGLVISAIDMIRTAIQDANSVKLLEGGGGVESLRSAIEQDTKAWKENGQAIGVAVVEYDNLDSKAKEAANATTIIKNVNGELTTVVNSTTSAIKTQTVAIGNNTKEWMLNAIVGNEKINGWLKDNPSLFSDAEQALSAYGTSFSDLMKDVLSDPKNGGATAVAKIDKALSGVNSKLVAYQKDTQNKGNLRFDKDYQRIVALQQGLIKLKLIMSDAGSSLSGALNVSSFVKSMKAALGITDDLGDSITNTTAKVKTLTQWAGEVGQVMQSAFDIRYGKITALDNVRKAWFDLKKRVDDAKKAIKKAQDQMAALKATKGVLEYQLGVALKYGDSKRAAEIQAKLAENATSISEAADQEAEAQKNASMELRDGSEAAIQNRAALGGLVQTYIPYIQALLNSGKSQKEVAVEIDKLKQQFAAQAKEIGFADADLTGYLGTFDTYKTVVEKMPKDVTVNIKGLDAATRAMKEFASAITSATSESGKLDDLADSLKNVYSQTPATGSIGRRAIAAQITQKEISLQMYKGLFAEARTTAEKLRYVNIVDRLGLDLKALQNSYAQFATGGYVSGPGTGTSDSVNAKLSNGEFVMSAKSVSTYGVDFMNALNQSKVLYNTTPMQQSQAQSGTSLVYLSPDDRALLRAAIDRPVNLYADSTRLAQSVNNGNKILAQRGTI